MTEVSVSTTDKAVVNKFKKILIKLGFKLPFRSPDQQIHYRLIRLGILKVPVRGPDESKSA